MTRRRRNKADPAVTGRFTGTIAGSTGLKKQGGVIREEFLRDLTGPRGMATLNEMRENHPVIASMRWLVESTCRQVEQRITPALKDDPASEDCAQFVRECLNDMDHSPQVLLTESLTAIDFGWALQAIQYKIRGGASEDPERRSRYSDGRIGWRRISLRSQTSLVQWRFDDPNDPDTATAMIQRVAAGDTYEIPLNRCFHFRVREELNNPEGRSLYRGAYVPWYGVTHVGELELIGIERDATGLATMQVPPEALSANATSEQKAMVDLMLNLMSQVRRDEREGLVIPAEKINGQETGFKFELVRGGGPRQIDIDSTIRRLDSRIAMVLLADFLLLGQDKTTSYNAVSKRSNMFGLSLDGILDKWCHDFTVQCIHPLCELNGFDESVWPKAEHGPVDAPTPEQVAAVLKVAVETGAVALGPQDEAWVRGQLGMPQRDAVESIG